MPYIYSPVYEGGECSPNVYCLGETPPQQAQPAIEFLAKEKKRQDLLPDRRRLRLAAQGQRAGEEVSSPQYGGKVVGEEYVPFGAPNKFEEAVTRIKAAKPDAVISHPGRRRQRQLQPHLRRLRPRQDDRPPVAAARGEHAAGRRRREQRQPLFVHGLLRQQPVGRGQGVQGRVHGQVRREGAAAQRPSAPTATRRSTSPRRCSTRPARADAKKLAGGVRRPGLRHRRRAA